MVRETQKEKIERLERELSQAQEVIKEQNNKIDSMIDKADNSFENSVTYEQMKKQIEISKQIIKNQDAEIAKLKKQYKEDLTKAYTETAMLESQIETKEKECSSQIKELERYYTYKLESKGEKKVHNERRAGRKQQILEDERQKIRDYRAEGHTIKEISKIFNRSVGIIHKIINEK